MDILCKKCKIIKDENLFSLRLNPAGIKVKKGSCIECERKRYAGYRFLNKDKNYSRTMKNNYALKERNRAYVNRIKARTPCYDCGIIYASECMEFDHGLDSNNKKATIAHMVGISYSIATIQAEINKCQLVCANCHRVRTRKQGYWIKKHGTLAMDPVILNLEVFRRAAHWLEGRLRD